MPRGYSAIALANPKNAVNVGSALRIAYNFRAGLVVVQGQRDIRASTDTLKAWRHMPVQRTNDLMAHVPYGAIPVVVELVDGAESLITFRHPERAYYIFGPEDGSVPERIRGRCPVAVQVPTRQCMNLAVTIGVVLYDRLAKSQ